MRERGERRDACGDRQLPPTVSVLVVDDDRELLALAAQLLERERPEFEVTCESSVEDAVTRLDEREWDAVVSDYEMPDADGLEFLAAVRERDDDLPFVLFTGTRCDGIAREAAARGATDYLRKRVGVEQFSLLADRLVEALLDPDRH